MERINRRTVQKRFNDPANHDGVVTHLESDTTEHAHMHSLIVKHKIASFSMFSIIETQRKK